MLRTLFFRFILPLIAFLVIRFLLKSVWGSLNTTSSNTPVANTDARTGGELKKDPVCGTYVAATAAVTRKVDGEILHFCSTACRDKYRTV